MTITYLVLLTLAALVTAAMVALSREMWTGDGFGRIMARGLTTLAVIPAWTLLAAAWIVVATQVGMPSGRVAVAGAALAVMCAAGWATIKIAGRANTPRWLAVALNVPPFLLITLAALAGQPHWRAAVPDLVVQTAWLAVFALAALPWPWVIRNAQLHTRARASSTR